MGVTCQVSDREWTRRGGYWCGHHSSRPSEQWTCTRQSSGMLFTGAKQRCFFDRIVIRWQGRELCFLTCPGTSISATSVFIIMCVFFFYDKLEFGLICLFFFFFFFLSCRVTRLDYYTCGQCLWNFFFFFFSLLFSVLFIFYGRQPQIFHDFMRVIL